MNKNRNLILYYLYRCSTQLKLHEDLYRLSGNSVEEGFFIKVCICVGNRISLLIQERYYNAITFPPEANSRGET